MTFKSSYAKLTEAQESYDRATISLQSATQKADQIKTVKRELEKIESRWNREKTDYSTYVEGGLFFEILDKLAVANNVNDINIQIRGSEKNFHKNHMYATAFDLTLKGSFWGVYKVLNGLENSSIPIEVKPIMLTSEAEGVKAQATAVIYSTNPPSEFVYVAGDTGKYDPFSNEMFQEIEDALLAELEAEIEAEIEDETEVKIEDVKENIEKDEEVSKEENNEDNEDNEDNEEDIEADTED
jgi:hypothetical protein